MGDDYDDDNLSVVQPQSENAGKPQTSKSTSTCAQQ